MNMDRQDIVGHRNDGADPRGGRRPDLELLVTQNFRKQIRGGEFNFALRA